MNAVNTLLRTDQEASFYAAVERADAWLDLARPIIVASLKLEDIEADIVRGSSFDYKDAAYRTLSEGRRYVTEARQQLEQMLEGIRDDFIADERKTDARNEAEAEDFDNFNDGLDGEVLTVANAVKRIEREWNDAFAAGKPL